MSPSGAEFIRQIKSQIAEVDPAEVHAALDDGNGNGGVTVVDVRETDEIAQGHLPGAKLIPRGYLESRIDGAVPDRSSARRPVLRLRQPLGARRQDARRARLRERRVDDRRHHAVEGPRLQGRRPAQAHAPSSASATAATCSCRRSAPRASRSCSTPRSCCSAPAASGSPTALYLAAAGVGTIGIVDDDVVDLSNLQRQVIHTTDRIGVPKVDSAEITMKALNPDVERREVRDAHRRLEHHGDHRGLRRHRRRRRQLPDALPAQRRDACA